MTNTRKLFVAGLLILTTPLLASCELPMPPVDGVAQHKQDEEKKREEQRAKAQAAAEAALAQQEGLQEGGPSFVNAAQRLQFLQSTDITIEYKGLSFLPLNTESGELVIPANSRVIQQGVKKKLEEVPKLYKDGQFLPKADLNGQPITIVGMSERQSSLVLTILGKTAPYKNGNAAGSLLLKAPEALVDMCKEAPGVDCSGMNLFGRDLTDMVLDGFVARNANLTNVNAPGASLTNCDFSGSQLFRGNFLGADVSGCRFKGVRGQNLMMNSSTTTQETLTEARGTDFTGAYLYRCEFDNTDMRNSVWDKADAQNCTFDKARMDNFRASGTWLHRLKASGVSMKNAIAPNVRMSQGTLANSNLSGSNLSGGLLDRVEAKGANFSNVILTGKNCTMAQAYLDNATLTDLEASGCSFPRSSWKDASARSMNIPNADLTYTDLKGADFSHTNAIGVDFFNADTKGLKADGMQLMGATCPNGDVVGKTAYTKWRKLTRSGLGVNDKFVVTGCVWDDPTYSISGTRLFETRSVSAGVVPNWMKVTGTPSRD